MTLIEMMFMLMVVKSDEDVGEDVDKDVDKDADKDADKDVMRYKMLIKVFVKKISQFFISFSPKSFISF